MRNKLLAKIAKKTTNHACFCSASASVCAVLLLWVAVVFTAQAEVPWRKAKDLPYRVQEIYPTIFEDHIVVAGGLSPDVDNNPISVSDRVVVYSLKHNTWGDGPTLPEPRHHPMLVVVSNRLFAFGGFTVDDQGAWHNSTDVLQLVIPSGEADRELLQHGRWQKVAQMPEPLAETLSAVYDGKVHLAGGRTPIQSNKNSQWNDQTDVSSHFIFDPDTLAWTEGESLPTARNSACGVQLENRWHTIAGRTVSGGNLATHEVYDFDTEQWQSLAPLPQAQGGLACAAIDDRIYVFGGEFFDNGGGVYDDVWQYDPATKAWRSVTKMPFPRHGLGALAIEDRIYVIAGALQAGGNQTSNVMTLFTPGQ